LNRFSTTMLIWIQPRKNIPLRLKLFIYTKEEIRCIMKKNKQLYHQLIKKGVINKNIQMKEINNLLHDMKKYNAKEDINKIYEKK